MTDTAKPKGPGFFGFIKEAVFESAPETGPVAPAAPAPAPAVPRQAYVPGTFIPVTMPRAAVPAPTPPDAKALAKLELALIAASPSAYVSFMETYASLAEDIPDEATRFRVALKTSKATVEQLAQAVDSLFATLGNAQAEFEKKFNEKKQVATTAAEGSLKATRAAVELKTQQMLTLQNEIAALHEKLASDSQSISEADAKLETVRAGFAAAYAEVSGRLNEQKTRIASRG